MRRCLHLLLVCVAGAVLAGAAQAQPQPTEYQTTTTWWTKRGKATEGNPLVVFALPVVSGTVMEGLVTLACPRQSERGAFLEIPMTVYPHAGFKGQKVGTLIGINSQAFFGFVDDNRFLVYLNAPPAPPVRGMKPGTSVRAALMEANGVIQIRLDPARPGGIVIKPARLDQTLPAMIAYLQGQGLQPTGLDQALKICDAFMKGAN